MVMDLGTTTIVAGQGDFSAYNYGNNGANWPAPSPAQVGYISKGQRDVAYVNGDWEKPLLALWAQWANWGTTLYGYPSLPFPNYEFIWDIFDLPQADYNQFSLGDDRITAMNRAQNHQYPFPNNEGIPSWDRPKIDTFNGGVYTPAAAFAHYLTGKGKKMNFPIERLNIKPNVKAMPQFIGVLTSSPMGQTTVDFNVPYATAKDSWVAGNTVGEITLRIVGILVKSTSGQWSFRGEIRAYDDLYDFNPSNHRTETAEGMTRLGSEVGQKFKDTTPYPIGIPGAIPVNISG